MNKKRFEQVRDTYIMPGLLISLAWWHIILDKVSEPTPHNIVFGTIAMLGLGAWVAILLTR